MSKKGTELARKLLAQHSLPGAHVGQVLSVLKRGQRARVEEGDVLCKEGMSGGKLFFLLDGQVRVTRARDDGEEQELAILEAPAILGHVSLIDGSPRSASCTVVGSAFVVQLEQDVYEQVLREASSAGTLLRRMLLSSLIQQLSAGNAKIRSVLAGEEPTAPAPPPARETRPAAPRPTPTSPTRRGRARPPKSARSPARREVSAEELLQVAGVMEDWQVDMRGLNRMEVVMDEDAKRTLHDRRRR